MRLEIQSPCGGVGPNSSCSRSSSWQNMPCTRDRSPCSRKAFTREGLQVSHANNAVDFELRLMMSSGALAWSTPHGSSCPHVWHARQSMHLQNAPSRQE